MRYAAAASSGTAADSRLVTIFVAPAPGRPGTTYTEAVAGAPTDTKSAVARSREFMARPSS